MPRRRDPQDLLERARQMEAEARTIRAEAERRIVRDALARNDGHVTRTAEELGLADHASLLKIMRRLGLDRD